MILRLFQLGRGRVGAALADQIGAARAAVRECYGVDLEHAMAGREEAPALIERALSPQSAPAVLVDATAADGMAPLHERALRAGLHVVTCNKKPIAGPLRDWRAIEAAARAASRRHLREVTCGAGLPVLRTLADLRDTGDAIASVEGCVSGTLNFLSAALDRGAPFSEALGEAARLGYTEPDPRQDLSGEDAARKAIILAREAGLAIEPEAVRREPFCDLGGGADAAAFLAAAAGLDAPLARRFANARGRRARLRYVLSVNVRDGACSVGLREVEEGSPLAALAGPENVFVFRTRRYHRHPLVIAGPGAGPEVTAAGAFGDILDLARGLAAGAGGVRR